MANAMNEETSQGSREKVPRTNGERAGPGAGNGSAGPGEPGLASPAGAAEGSARQRHEEGGLNLKPSGRISAPAAPEAGAVTPPEGQAIENPVFACREVSVFYGQK
jgi:hypothetical protein